MAKIVGTKWADELYGTAEADLIRGRAGDDVIIGEGGEDRLYGGAGNDLLGGSSDRVQIYGGRGDDTIGFARGYAYGGVGNDTLSVYGGGGWAIGGKGDDTLRGSGYLIGDEAPGIPERVAGNDHLFIVADNDGARGHGGLGNDTFIVALGNGGDTGFHVGIVDDFKPGEDKFAAIYRPLDVDTVYDLFNDLDVNKDGLLNRADTFAGAQVWIAEETNTMILGGYDEGRIVIHGTTQLSHATDWLV